MLGRRAAGQQELVVAGTLDDLVPADYILRRVDRVLDLSWLEAAVAHLYSPGMGRPSVAPETALRLMLAGFFHGIVHDRELVREASMHLGIRWFCGLGLGDRPPDHSSLTRIRQRFGAELFRELFDRVVSQCITAGLVSGETVHIDATLIAADCDWRRVARRHADRTIEANAEQLPAPPPPRPSDPDAGLSKKRGGAAVFGYKQHGAVDSASGIFLDCEVTPASQNEGAEMPAQLERIEQRLGREPATVTADAAYGRASNLAELERRGVRADVAMQPPTAKPAALPSHLFKYDAVGDHVRCPAGQILTRRGKSQGGWRYRSAAAQCRRCPLRARCLAARQCSRTVEIVTGYPALLRARRAHARDPVTARPAYRRHRWMIEGRHGEAKGLYGLGRAVRRGLQNVRIQALLTACVMNLKRLARSVSPSKALFPALVALIVATLSPRGPRSQKNLAPST